MKNKKNILIIGGAGYIGSRLAEELRFFNNIVCLDIFKCPSINLDNVKYIKQDYGNITKDYVSNFDTIILLAGHSSVRMCDGKSSGIMKNNVFNFVKLLDLIENQTFIYASSASVYGNCKYDLAKEETPYDFPYNMYDMSKQTIDSYVLASKMFSKKIFGLRFGTVNGYSKNFRNDVMLNAMSATAINEKIVNVYNPNTKRSILGIKDLVNSIQTIINSEKEFGGLYNLASFTKTSGEMGSTVSAYFGVPLNIISVDNNKEKNLNEKFITSKYDFALDVNKFCKDFNFQFKETEFSIISEIKNNWENMVQTSRNEKFDYEVKDAL